MSKNENSFSARDLELLTIALSCLKSEIQVDMPKYAAKGGFKNANSARVSWFNIRKKIEKMASEGGDVSLSIEKPAKEAPAAAKAGGKKRKKAGQDDEDDGEGENITVKTKAKRGRKVEPKEATPDPDDSVKDEDENEK